MKKIISIIFMLISVLFISGTAFAAEYVYSASVDGELSLYISPDEKSYEISVTGEQVQMLLKTVPAMEEADFSMIETLKVKLITKDAVLDRMELFGKADMANTVAEIEITASEFEILKAGEFTIPSAVKDNSSFGYSRIYLTNSSLTSSSFSFS